MASPSYLGYGVRNSYGINGGITGSPGTDVSGRRGALFLALSPGRFEFIAVLPSDEIRQTGGFPAESESESRHRGVSDEIHLGTILVTGLVIAFLDVLPVLLQSPRFRM